MSDMDREQLVQSSEFANTILPALRDLAGYEDYYNSGTYTKVPNIRGMSEDEIEDELNANLNELLDAFWEGYESHHEDDEDPEPGDIDPEDEDGMRTWGEAHTEYLEDRGLTPEDLPFRAFVKLIRGEY